MPFGPLPVKLTDDEIAFARRNFESGRMKPTDTSLCIYLAREFKKPPSEVGALLAETHRCVRQAIYGTLHPMDDDRR